MQKKIKLKGSSYWDRRKPINKKRKMKEAVRSIDSFSKKRPINRPKSNKHSISRDNTSNYISICWNRSEISTITSIGK